MDLKIVPRDFGGYSNIYDREPIKVQQNYVVNIDILKIQVLIMEI